MTADSSNTTSKQAAIDHALDLLHDALEAVYGPQYQMKFEVLFLAGQVDIHRTEITQKSMRARRPVRQTAIR